ncbi:MAG: hypothetical protein IPK81_03580 [Rhodospirillales bacterium]|nr:MAG: hypothetical protein IPK81_03580 [Rhodospirillales bacterium]
MFGLFKSPPFVDPALGTLARSGGLWRCRIRLDGADAAIPLAVAGPRAAPDPAALALARAVAASYPAWRGPLAAALFDHYQPYAEAGADEAGGAPAPVIAGPSAVWPHVSPVFVAVAPLDGALATEIGLNVAWDEEHTLAARFRDGQLVELNGSVVAP